MARLRDSRSPTPAGSQPSSRRHRRDDDRRDRDRFRDRDRDRDRRDYGRDTRRWSRSRSPHDRRNRDRDRDRDRDHDIRRRDRSVDRRDDDDYYRGARDRRRSRDRLADREIDRSNQPRRRRSRDRDGDRDHRSRRDDSRDRGRGRREGTADSHPRSRRGDSRERGAAPNDTNKAKPSDVESKPKPAPAQSDTDKKAERLAKLAAWKKKQEEKEKEKQKEPTPGGTRKLLAEMDEKANTAPSNTTPIGVSPTPISPADTQAASPTTPYAGKFDPKAIAKKSAPKAHSTITPKLGAVAGQQPSITLNAGAQASNASALPQSRAKTSGFGFHKQNAETEKVPQKRKLILDEEETSDRKLAKLPSLPLSDVDDTPYANQDEEEDDDADPFAGDEEEEAAAARAAQERREERIAQENAQQTTEMQVDQEGAVAPETNGIAQNNQPDDVMEVDEDDVDPLDAFMNGLETKPATTNSRPKASLGQGKDLQEPEAYFSDDGYDYRNENVDPDSFLAIAAKARKKKDIPSVDYSKLDLDPVRKNFWVEPSELAEMTDVELADLRVELDGIKVSGKDVPKPVQKWSQCALSRKTLDIIDSLGYEKPTPIQMQAFPTIMSGRDVIGVAKTGSGKTLAFLLPMFRHIKDQRPLKENEGPIGLIMTPTRELATQIFRDCKPFLKSMNLRAVCAYGGAPIKDHIAELKRGAEVVVCTPGRMIDLLAANQGRVTNLKRVTYVVLDEADRMFDMGFEPQVMKIFANMRPDRQTILFSATMPRIMDALAKKVLNNPVEITVGGKSVVAPEITQVVEIREENTKFVRLLELLGELYDIDEDARALIFVDRQEKADDLLKELLRKGYPCMSIHGGKDQIDRDSTIIDFKAGVIPVLIATSVAARGLDVKQLKLVVNYDAPNHLEDYVHRAGRTGRAGNKGTAVTFITREQENCAPGIAKALEQSGQEVPAELDEMRKAFRDKVKSGKAKDQSGFGGKGLERLDQEREAARLRERKSHRTEGDEEEEKKEEKKGEDKKGDKALSAIQTAASGIISRDAATPKIDLEPKFTIHKREDAAPPASANNPLDKVSSAINAINARLGRTGQLRPGQPIDNKGPDAGAFHATLEINDFPQKARWAVTNRTNVAKILEATGTSITNKGTFYRPGQEVPPDGEPKLYILVEGDTELMVANAMAELTRLLKEGTIAAADADNRAPIGGRYTVT
ncbi:P-loop containing nucleoside triphosphate hydrolase protein [Daldinia caldariorum]|uniref:P-loop containing nucleoside triphosphate hydrolase protein n=1 Tax=Daldinia caldariorum TaxID=326644 RepID=UPI002008C9D1|nr:P-loop containing nucleoside triphosphate hydrolase protein [Daldinia caldariorum]KAI1466846.1 P-loop containing nucleoside triphosphate hydrolase protein [Daldinia caldariorum]